MAGFQSHLIVAVVAGMLVFCGSASAQDYPTRSVKIIVPAGAGGGADIFTRIVADELRRLWSQPVIVENRTGGSFNIGARACAESPPDGYTLCQISSEPIVYNQFLFKSLPFNPEKDFAPIAAMLFNPVALVANSSLNVKTIPELIALAKAKPGSLNYGTFSFPLQQFMEKLKREHDLDIVRVPFRSGNEMVNAILSGSTPIAFLGLANMISQLQSGRIYGIAVNANKRSPLFPDMPTLTEASGENYPPSWFGLFAPTGTPKPIIAKVAADFARIAGAPAFQQKNYIDRAVEYVPYTPDEFARFIIEDRKSAERIVRESGQKPQ